MRFNKNTLVFVHCLHVLHCGMLTVTPGTVVGSVDTVPVNVSRSFMMQCQWLDLGNNLISGPISPVVEAWGLAKPASYV